jgi:UDP:flavonoid glycosyltransferase YjiC (YdhE family)
LSAGGSGSVLGALTHGVPMVLLPMGADQPLDAQRATALGAALTLDAVSANPEEIREAVTTVLADHGFRRNAEALRDEIASLPGPERAVELLEQVAVTRVPLLAR